MKHCQTCHRIYTDESLGYCLDDGSLLSDAPDSEATLVRSKVPVSMPPRAAIGLPHLQLPRSSHRWILYPAILLLTLLVGASAGWFIYEFEKHTLSISTGRPSDTPTPISVTQTPTSVTDESSSPSTPQAIRQDDPESLAIQNLTGTWTVVNTVEKTSYRSFANLRIGYRLIISQSGRNFTAGGEKLLENGRTLPTSGRTAIHLTGAVEGKTIGASFVEEGARRKTSGRVVWRLQREGTLMKGTFVSTAANSSGTSVATKER